MNAAFVFARCAFNDAPNGLTATRFVQFLMMYSKFVLILLEIIRKSINKTSSELLGKKNPKQQKPWISTEVLELCKQRSRVKLQRLEDASLKPKYNYLNREIKRKTNECKDKWLRGMCRDVDEAHEAKKTKQIYSTIKTITGTRSTSMSSVKDKNCKVLTEDSEVMDRWRESFKDLFNKESPDDTSILQSIPIPEEDDDE